MSQSPENLRAWASINLSALERNLKAIRSALPPHLKYIAVVKANAYGHGLAPVVTRLMRSEADAFAVANLDEAERIREVGSGWPVLVLSALLPSEYKEAIRMGVHPVVSSQDELMGFSEAAKRLGKTVAIHLKVDTGMGRLGVWYPDFQNLYKALDQHPHVRVKGLCTHFSSADTDPEFTGLQRQRFIDCLHTVPQSIKPNLLVHADNSSGIESFPKDGPFNGVRIGLMQFGVRPTPGSLLGSTLTEPVLSFHARVGLVKDLPAGTAVSYGQSYRLNRPSRIAILTAGYADGLTTSLGNKGQVIIKDTLCPIIGRVTMDQTIVDITELAEPPPRGAIATFIGNATSTAISVSQFAEWSGQIEWEAFCSISARTQRIYRTDSAV
jgi:alanine racemase